jgi:hypothetical protein
MAATSRGRQLTETHRLAQVRVGVATGVQMRDLWRLLDPTALAETSPVWIDAAVRMISTQHGISADLARRYYQALRVAELGVPLTGTLAAPPLVEEAVRTSLAVTGPVRIERAIRRSASIEAATRTALTETARSAQRHALTGGRAVIVETARRDPRSGGWMRVTSGNACTFCESLAVRGAVFGEESVSFAAHDGCRCTGEPEFR